MKYALSALAEIDSALARARQVLIATDFDGTLCPIVNSPERVQPSRAMLEVLRQVGTCERMVLAVVSGRALGDVMSRLAMDVIFAGNHGLEIRGRGLDFEHPAARGLRDELAAMCRELARTVQPWPGAWVEDKDLSATVHYRNVEPRFHRAVLRAVRGCAGRAGTAFSLRAGNHAMEVRPKLSWEKGSALDYIRENVGPFDLTIALGDDRTDETMFAANHDGISIKVGSQRPTRAGYYLWDASEVAIFLSHIGDVCQLQAPAAVRAFG